MRTYREVIERLIDATNLPIDANIQAAGSPPTLASSQFLTNREQGDWAEQIILNAVNEHSRDYCAVGYGRSDRIAAGDPGFVAHYRRFQAEQNRIGKKPDILIFQRRDYATPPDVDDDDVVSTAIAAIEIRSSSFLSKKYMEFVKTRARDAESECARVRSRILQTPSLSALLKKKNPTIHRLLMEATTDTFRDLDFRPASWSSSEDLRQLSSLLRRLKEQIRILHKRDFLSITPKLEDIALVNRWIQHYGVRHYYLQVFFDSAYVVSFQNVLELIADPDSEGTIFAIERDVKNQRKTTIKISIEAGREILGRIDMPTYRAAMKELDRGRLLFYVKFEGGGGYLDPEVFHREIGADGDHDGA